MTGNSEKELPNIIAFSVNDKGGVGKSQTSQVLREMLVGSIENNTVLLIDSDPRNSSLAQVYEGTNFADTRDQSNPFSHGPILLGMDGLIHHATDHAVVDTAAGTQTQIEEQIIPTLAEMGRPHGIRVVEYITISTSEFSQDNALLAAERSISLMETNSAYSVVFVRNHGLGRADRFYQSWHTSIERERLIPPVVEVALPDFGPTLSDEATALGLSLADVALGKFERLQGRALEIAQSKFSPSVRIVLAQMLRRTCDDFQKATLLALENYRLG